MKQIKYEQYIRGKYYLAYLNASYGKRIHFGYYPVDSIGNARLLDVFDQPAGYRHLMSHYNNPKGIREFNFGCAWELFELTDDEVLRHIVMELI